MEGTIRPGGWEEAVLAADGTLDAGDAPWDKTTPAAGGLEPRRLSGRASKIGNSSGETRKSLLPSVPQRLASSQ